MEDGAMKIIHFGSIAAFIFSTNFGINSTWAAEPMNKRGSLEKFEKDIAKDKERVSSKKAEITTEQAKLDQDVSQYGKDSKEARNDRDSLTKLRNDYIDAKTDLYKDINKKKVAEGQPVESE